jgi:regulatory GntR family protein
MEISGTGIAESLRQRIAAELHLGTLHPGDRLPSHRELSAELHANPRRVLEAYQQLSAEGLVSLRPRSGVFAQGPARRGDDAVPDVVAWMLDTFMRGLAQGAPPTDLWGRIQACLDRARVRAACVECNADQIYSLTEQLRADYGFETVGVEAAAVGRRHPLPADAADPDLIVTTAFHGDEAHRLGRRLRRPVLVATLDAAFATAVQEMLAQGPVWWVCSDPRFAAKLPRMFPSAAIHPVVLGDRPPDAIPPEATVYATRCAAARLPSWWHGGRVHTIARVFSAETARALLAFLMLRNVEAARGPVRQARRARRS